MLTNHSRQKILSHDRFVLCPREAEFSFPIKISASGVIEIAYFGSHVGSYTLSLLTLQHDTCIDYLTEIFLTLQTRKPIGAPNELFCKKAVLQWVFCWEN